MHNPHSWNPWIPEENFRASFAARSILVRTISPSLLRSLYTMQPAMKIFHSFSIALVASFCIAISSAKADMVTIDFDLEGWGGAAEIVVNNVGVALPDVASIDAVTIQLSHSWASDIVFTLTSPTGDVFTLAQNNGSGDDLGDGGDLLAGVANYVFVDPVNTNGTWDDALASPIPAGTYDAQTWQTGGWAAGNWLLFLEDNAGGDTGALGSISIAFTTVPVPEPCSVAWLSCVAMGLVIRRRRR